MSEKTIKQYKSNTSIAVSILLKSKKSMHVTFTPLSNGTSVYATDNPEVQRGLESHYKFGKLFKLVKESKYDPDKPEPPKVEDTETHDGDGGKQELVIKVADLQEAKDYVADTFGLSRTSLKTKQNVINAAAEHGVKFEGLN